MKFCEQFYNFLYLDHYNGNMFLCPWMEPKYAIIGNLFKDNIEEAYNSEYANQLRKTMDDQSFYFCRPEACPHLQNDDLKEVSCEEYEKQKKDTYYPTIINMAYDFVCNQSCETCRKSVFIPPKGYKEQLETIHKKIAPYLDTAKRITASGHGDPFASPYMMSVLENLHPQNSDMEILLETNGVFFDEEHWEKIKHLREAHLEISVTSNSFDEFTYNHISRGGNFKKLMHNLEFISELRKNGEISHLSHCFVIQDRNFRELPSFIKKSFEEYAFDGVILRPVYQWGTMDEAVFWFKDVLNPLHPYHEEYLEILKHPILKDPRVYNFGGETEHPARPYPVKDVGLFPYNQVKKRDRVVVYGAGQIGKEIMRELKENTYCTAELWIDKNFDDDCVKSPNILLNMPQDAYDKVLLATTSPVFANEMKENLMAMEISEEKIISMYNKC